MINYCCKKKNSKRRWMMILQNMSKGRKDYRKKFIHLNLLNFEANINKKTI